jgi:hypothetical protein
MGKMQIPQRIRLEDFKAEQQDMAGKIGQVINQPLEEIYNILSNNVDFSNLNRQLTVISVSIGKDSKLINTDQIKLIVTGQVRGINVINAINLNNPGTYPISTPFVSFISDNKTLTVVSVVGLQASSLYQLTLEIIA